MAAPGVYLVGAGPGPADLLTVRALRLIQCADVIVHDHLVGAGVLAAARPGAELVPVGKRAGGPCTPQSAIDALLVERGLRGGVVVRLKGGDPFVFGRGGEEAEALHAAGVPYEIVPGITAALAAGAFAGIPLTHRAHSSAIVFLTGHEDPAKPSASVRWEDYARLNATLCVYMGVRNLPKILDRLTAAGLPAGTPAALVHSAGDPDRQRVLLATAGTLAGEAAAADFASPSLAIIGPVAEFAHRLKWFGDAGRSQIALIDNGSLAPAAHETLREVAAAISQQAGVEVTPVSWKHSDRITLGDGTRPWTLAAWVEAASRRSGAPAAFSPPFGGLRPPGDRRREAPQPGPESSGGAASTGFVFLPFFVSPEGAIGEALRRDLDALQEKFGPFPYRIAPGLTPAVLAEILADRVRAAEVPDAALVLVDHGGPSATSARVRDETAALLAARLHRDVIAASMEGAHGPLLAEALATLPPGKAVLIATLFLAPGRHAGPTGDLSRIAAAAARGPFHFTAPLGTHPLVASTLALALHEHVPVLR